MPKTTTTPYQKTSTTTTITATTLLLLLLLIIYRLVNTLLVQTQFDPDEYWQTLEPSYCLVFSPSETTNCAYTWEWTRRWTDSSSSSSSSSSLFHVVIAPLLQFLTRSCRGPIRSHVGLLPTLLCYRVVKMLDYFGEESSVLIARGPLVVHAWLVVVPTDISCYIISRAVVISDDETGRHEASSGNDGRRRRRRYYRETMTTILIVASGLTSWFLGYALVRTYSNSIECVLITGGLGLMSRDLFGRNPNPTTHPSRRTAMAFVIAGLSLSLRFSAIAAWIPIALAYCWRRLEKKTRWRSLVRGTIGPCVGYTAIGLFLACVLDYYFYGFWTVPFLGAFYFNVVQGHGSLYGTHPIHWYVTSCLPAISGVMLPFFLHNSYNAITTSFRRQQQQQQRHGNDNDDDDDDDEQQIATNNDNRLVILFIITVYTLIHSLSSHKELRFLLPILPLVCILSGHSMERFCRRRRQTTTTNPSSSSHWHYYYCPYKTIVVASLLLFGNYPHLYYLTRIHQRAPIAINRSILKFLSSTTAAARTKHAEVHYLMGCHSTPLYSHLHSDVVSITAWTLDCSPECRVAKNCESDEFLSDPLSFVRRTYGVGGGTATEGDAVVTTGDDEGEEGDAKDCRNHDDAYDDAPSTQHCHQKQHHHRSIPDCLVMFENDASSPELKTFLRRHMGMKEIDRQPHVMNGWRIKWGTIVDLKWGALSETKEEEEEEDDRSQDETTVTRRRRRVDDDEGTNDDGSFVRVSFEHMILYAKVELALLD